MLNQNFQISDIVPISKQIRGCLSKKSTKEIPFPGVLVFLHLFQFFYFATVLVKLPTLTISDLPPPLPPPISRE